MAVATHAKRHVCRRKFLTSEITDECYFKKLSFMECSRSCCFTAKLCSSRRRKTTKTFVHSCSSTSSSKNNSRDDSTSLTSDFEGSSVTSPLPQMVLCTDCSNGWKRIQRASRHFQLQKIILTWSQQLLCTPSSSLLRLFSLLSLLVLLQSTQFTVCSAQKLIYKSHSSSVNTNPATSNVVIPHIKYGQGLNKWSFLSVDRDNHGLHSDLLCPNPMITSSGTAGYSIPNRSGGGGRGNVGGGGGGGQGGGGGRGRQQQQEQKQRYPIPSSPNQQQHILPNEIWALKTDEPVSKLPCGLRVPSIPFNGQGNGNNLIMINTGRGGNPGGGAGSTRHHNPGHFIDNRILFANVSLVPFNFRGAIPCSKYIKLMYDEEEGTYLRCKGVPFDNKNDNKYHINWPDNLLRRKDYFSLLETLEQFLQNEQTYRRQFYFQIFFSSQFNGRKRCTVQQYQLDLSYPAGNARFCNLTQLPDGHEELCGEFHCDDLIFPMYTEPIQHHTGHGVGGRQRGRGGGGPPSEEEDDEDDYDDDEDYDDEDDTSDERHHHSKGHHPNLQVVGDVRSSLGQTYPSSENFSWTRMLRTDLRLLIFVTIVPLVLFGVLIFGLELIVYFMCCRKKRGDGMEGGSIRSDQLLQNSLNVWENVPSRMDCQRTVSFSPMTTSIYGERKNMQMMDAASLESHPETPKILKSALKKQGGEHSSPTSAAHHYFEYDHDMPPSYIETTTR